jgi:hypothetical protein
VSIIIKQAGGSITKNRAEAIDNVLSYLFLAENKESWDWLAPRLGDAAAAKAIAQFQRVPLIHFDGADVSLLYESLTETTSYDRMFFRADQDEDVEELRRLSPHWDHTSAHYFPEVLKQYAEKIGERTYLFSFLRHRSVPLREVRGLFRLRSGFVLESSCAHILADGTYLSAREYLQYFAGGWHAVGIPFEIEPQRLDPEDERHQIWMARSFALTAEYEWSVHIGFNRKHLPTVSMPSDPLGAREVFRLRDIPPGKTRREALRHWVNAHTRRGVPPNYIETNIWPYLRGAEEFTWNGLYCKIQPSAYDLRKAQEYQLMRSQKKGPDAKSKMAQAVH